MLTRVLAGAIVIGWTAVGPCSQEETSDMSTPDLVRILPVVFAHGVTLWPSHRESADVPLVLLDHASLAAAGIANDRLMLDLEVLKRQGQRVFTTTRAQAVQCNEFGVDCHLPADDAMLVVLDAISEAEANNRLQVNVTYGFNVQRGSGTRAVCLLPVVLEFRQSPDGWNFAAARALRRC